MTKPQPAVEVFAGIDVSAREIKVARIQDKEGNPTLGTFANNASGHKALLAFLLQRACTHLLRSQRQLQPRPSITFACSASSRNQRYQSTSCSQVRGISRRAEQDRSGRCPCTLPICGAHALGFLAASESTCCACAPSRVPLRAWV